MTDRDDRPHLRVVQGELGAPELLPEVVDVEAQELLTESMYSALLSPETQTAVNKDVILLENAVFNNPVFQYRPTQINLGVINKDLSSLSVIDKNGVFVFAPGLIGLESFDYSSDEFEDKTDVVRLYCGVMLAHTLLMAKFKHEEFFRLVFQKRFAMQQRGKTRTETFGDNPDDPAVYKRQQRAVIAGCASGLALDSLFPEAQQSAMREILERRYEREKIENDFTTATFIGRLMIPERLVPEDDLLTETCGFARPVPKQELMSVLKGRLSKA